MTTTDARRRPLSTATWPTPLGPVTAAATDAGIVAFDFADAADAGPRPAGAAADHLDHLRAEAAAYFAGRLARFTVPLAEGAGTPFQRAAWAYLRQIPFGQTRTYGQQAAALGSPGAARAVGRANGANPLCLLVPCHRVVGATGHLTGYAAGVDRKRWLLDHERSLLDRKRWLLDHERSLLDHERSAATLSA